MQDKNNHLSQVLKAIDDANSRDPNKETVEGSGEVAKELIYGQRMTALLAEYSPDASEHLQIAVRAQHIERWKSPRSDFPLGRAGYKKWRSQLSLFHALRAGEIMESHGYGDDDIEKVKYLIQKRQIKRNPETQALEDTACLVFLKHYFADFAAKHEEAKIMDIVRKTWAKMSDKARNSALEIEYRPDILDLLQKTLNQ